VIEHHAQAGARVEDLLTSFGDWTVGNTKDVNPVRFIATLNCLVCGALEFRPRLAQTVPTLARDIDLIATCHYATPFVRKSGILSKY
jgi:hypothetical protein